MKLHQYACNMCRVQMITLLRECDREPVMGNGYSLSIYPATVHQYADQGKVHICYKCAALVVDAVTKYPPLAPAAQPCP